MDTYGQSFLFLHSGYYSISSNSDLVSSRVQTLHLNSHFFPSELSSSFWTLMKLLEKSHSRSRLSLNLLSQKSEVLLIWKLTFLFLIFSRLTRIGQCLQFFVVSFDRIQIHRFILPWFLRNFISRRTWCISPRAWYQNFKATNEQNINWAKPHFILKFFALFLVQSDSHKSNTVLCLGACIHKSAL